MVATYRKTQRLIGTLSKQTIKSIRLYYHEPSNPFILFEIVNLKKQSCFIYTDYLFSPFGLSYTYDYDKIDLDAMPEIKKLPKEMMESIERQVAKENKKDFTVRGKLFEEIESVIYSFKVMYGYPLSWVGEPMYTGPSFPIHEEGPSSGALFDIDLDNKGISVQDVEADDMMYHLRIGAMSTEQLRMLRDIVTKAITNPPKAWEGDSTGFVLLPPDDGMGLKIVGNMPLDLLARQTL